MSLGFALPCRGRRAGPVCEMPRWEQGLSSSREGMRSAETLFHEFGGGSLGTRAVGTVREGGGWYKPVSVLRMPSGVSLWDLRMPGLGGALGGGFVLLQRTFQKASLCSMANTGGQLILPLSSGLPPQLPGLGCGPHTVNPRRMPGPLPLIGLDGCAGLEGP